MVLLDTTFLSDLIRRRKEAVTVLEEMQARGERLATSTLNLAELYGGVFRLPQPGPHLESVERIAEALVLFDFDQRAAKAFGELDAYLASQGSPAPTKDLLIAAVALSHGEHEVLTRNQRDFARIPGIQVRRYEEVNPIRPVRVPGLDPRPSHEFTSHPIVQGAERINYTGTAGNGSGKAGPRGGCERAVSGIGILSIV